MTNPGDPPTAMEQRAESLGIRFARGRERTSNSHLALEAAEFATEEAPAQRDAFHRRMFRAYFEELADIGDVAEVVRLGVEVGLDGDRLGAALEGGRYRQQVDDGVLW